MATQTSKVSGIRVRETGSGLHPGLRVGKRIVLGWQYRAPRGDWRVVMLCDCGNVTSTRASVVKDQPACHLCAIERSSTKHGEARKGKGKHTKLYFVWAQMRARCVCKREGTGAYKHYASRGVSVCQEWQDYAVFREWAMANGYQEGLEIDRIDADGNYEPSNCRWITPADNRRRAVQRRESRRRALAGACSIALLFVASQAFAGHGYCSTGYCAPKVVQEVAYPQTIIQNQNVFYSVGEQVRQYAVTPQAVAVAHQESLKRQMHALQDQLNEYQTQQSYQPQPMYYVPMVAVAQQQQLPEGQAPCNENTCPPGAKPPSFNIKVNVIGACAKCHTKPGAALDALDMTKALSCEDQKRALKAVMRGTMPKGGRQLTDDQIDQLDIQLEEWKNAPSQQPAPETPPQQAPAEQPPEAPKEEPKFSNATRDWLKFAMQQKK